MNSAAETPETPSDTPVQTPPSDPDDIDPGVYERLHLASAGIAAALAAIALAVPFVVPFDAAVAAWWSVGATAAVLVGVQIVSLVRLRSVREDAASAPTLERPEPRDLDFDQPTTKQED